MHIFTVKQEMANFKTIHFLSFMSSKAGRSGPAQGQKVPCDCVESN